VRLSRLALAGILLATAGVASRAHGDELGPNAPSRSEGIDWPALVSPYFMMETDALVHSAEVEGENGFAIRRLRLGLDAHPLPWLRAVGIVEYAAAVEPNVHIWEGYVDVNPWEPLHLSFGFRRTPLFHIAKDELFEAMSVPELPLAVRSFWPGVDLGLEAHYVPTRVPVEAWARVGNGSATPLGNNTDKLAFEGRVDLVLGRPRSPSRARETFGLRLGAGGHVGTLENESGVEGSTAGDYVFYRPAVVNGLQSIVEAHVALWAGRATLDVEAGRVIEQRGTNATGSTTTPLTLLPSAQSWGGFVELAYMVWGTPRVPGGWPTSGPWNASLASGGVEIAGRFDYVALDQDAPGIVPGGAKGGEAALRWWVTSFLAVGVAGYYLRYDVGPVEEPTQKNSWLGLTRLTFSWR
jgi:phosphate-selective porin OprO and OprP